MLQVVAQADADVAAGRAFTAEEAFASGASALERASRKPQAWMNGVERTANARDDLLQIVDFIVRGTRFRQHRELVVTAWRMFYAIDTDVVRVIALFDGHCGLRNLLQDRFARASAPRGAAAA